MYHDFENKVSMIKYMPLNPNTFVSFNIRL